MISLSRFSPSKLGISKLLANDPACLKVLKKKVPKTIKMVMLVLEKSLFEVERLKRTTSKAAETVDVLPNTLFCLKTKYSYGL
jgi:hypothetical protein